MTEEIDKPPTNMDEYAARAHANYQVTGFGIDGTTVHMPCPFCSAKDWIVHKVIETEEAMKKGGTCKECGRAAKLVFTEQLGGKSFELVQTDGDPLPEWMTYQPRDIRHMPAGHA